MNKKVEQKKTGPAKKVVRRTEREIVEERREQVLAQGRKFKYPKQYAKHRLMIVTILISLLAVGALMGGIWFALYKAQNTDDITYRITQTLPVRVAAIDDADVKYSDYLMIYRSSLKTVEQQSGKLGNDEDAEAVKTQYKRQALDTAEEYAYAEKVAEEQGIEVADEEVDETFIEHQKVGGSERSEESFLKILQDNFGLSKSEYRRMLYLSLVKLKVSEKTDSQAQAIAKSVEQSLINNGGDLRAVAEGLGNSVIYEETGGLVSNANIDGGRASAAIKLEPGQVSERFVSSNGDGFYFVKLIAKSDEQVNYTSLKIPFSAFSKEIEELKSSGKITEYISL